MPHRPASLAPRPSRWLIAILFVLAAVCGYEMAFGAPGPVRLASTASASTGVQVRLGSPSFRRLLARAIARWHRPPHPQHSQRKVAAPLVSAPALIPGFGYTPPANACSCVWRDSSAGGHGGSLDCWRMDLATDPFPARPGHPANADYTAVVRRWHLHASAPDYYQPGQIPPGDEVLVKGYIPQGCDAESWLGRCADAMAQRCRDNAFGTAATHDCTLDPNNGVSVRELTDWLAVNQQPGTCPSPFASWYQPGKFSDGFESGSLSAWR